MKPEGICAVEGFRTVFVLGSVVFAPSLRNQNDTLFQNDATHPGENTSENLFKLHSLHMNRDFRFYVNFVVAVEECKACLLLYVVEQFPHRHIVKV